MLSASPQWMQAERTRRANLRLGTVLAFVAGAANAGGFLAVGQYTSHMSGIVSSLADDAVLGHTALVLAGLAALLAFVLGAMSTALMVNWARRRSLHSLYSLPLLVEAGFLLMFGLMGAILELHTALLVPLTVLLLCFIMGLQNALGTKMSRGELRTTHVTGLITDLGIELGKLVYINRQESSVKMEAVRANPKRLITLSWVLLGFGLGALCGAWGFKHAGYVTTVPLACLLAWLAWPALWQDAMALRRPAPAPKDSALTKVGED